MFHCSTENNFILVKWNIFQEVAFSAFWICWRSRLGEVGWKQNDFVKHVLEIVIVRRPSQAQPDERHPVEFPLHHCLQWGSWHERLCGEVVNNGTFVRMIIVMALSVISIQQPGLFSMVMFIMMIMDSNDIGPWWRVMVMTMAMMTAIKMTMTLTPGNLVIRVLVGAARRLHQSFNRSVLILKLIIHF